MAITDRQVFMDMRNPPLTGSGPLENAPLQREVRSEEPMDIDVLLTNTRCTTCKKDRRKCTRKEPNQTKCDRCLEFNYTCTLADINVLANGKRRVLQRLKCEVCRSAKVKCEPVDRIWPEKCKRCKAKGLACSEPQEPSRKVPADGRNVATPKSGEDSDESATEHSMTGDPLAVRARTQPEPKTRPGNSPLQSSNRQRKKQSISEIVDKVRNQPYSPLRDDEIRLLIVHPGLPDDDLYCSIITESLQNSQPYYALSYRWGSDRTSHVIKLVNYKAMTKAQPLSFQNFHYPKINTTSNLFEALRQLRKSKDTLRLYVNAICINHEDEKEKYYQTWRTREIFQRAINVIVWLGTKTATSLKAFEFIPEVLKLADSDSLLKDESKRNDWTALADLMRNSFFGRRWLIQELAVAKNATLHCGGDRVTWSEFSDAVLLFETNLPEIQRFFTYAWMSTSGPMDDIQGLGASKLVSVVSNVIQTSPDGKMVNYLQTLESLVSMLSVFEATDPLDTIIAVIGLAKDQAQLEPIERRIKSNQGVLEVYIAFIQYCVASGSIDMICRHWAPVMREPTHPDLIEAAVSTKVDLPSWIPNVSGSVFGAPREVLKGRVNGDSFVGLPNQQIYNAAFGFPLPNVTFGTFPNINGLELFDGTMVVNGYILDTIADLGARAAQGLIHRESLEMGGWRFGSQNIPERLWRTLVADRGHDNNKAPRLYARACLQCLELCDTNGDLNTNTVLNQPHCTDSSTAFLKRVQSATWNRKFLLSKSEAHGGRLLGLAPANSMVGDLICILYGCSVPVILREHVDDGNPYFEVIGESFIYGMMDGVARKELTDEGVEAETKRFKLR